MIYNYNVHLYEENKVSQLLDKINCSNNDLKTEVNICRSSHSASFNTASTYLSTVISRHLPYTHPSSRRYGRKRQVYSSGRGGKGGIGGQFEGRGGRDRGGQGGSGGRGKLNINQSENSVDIIDPTRWYVK